MVETLLVLSFWTAGVTAAVVVWNLALFRKLPKTANTGSASVSVLIPARDEETNIGEALRAVLGSESVDLEVLVLDDGSRDRTAAIVEEIRRTDSRVRLLEGGRLPEGWCGKQHACWQLAQAAKLDYLCFLDADVRIGSDALSRMCEHVRRKRLDLLSGFPRQTTVTVSERLLIPMIHFVLLAYLPVWAMRRFQRAGFGVGCGQLMFARREAYFAAGGHAAIRTTLHDGLKLPRLFRQAKLRTDIFDATDTAVCRMYRGAAEVFGGLGKNATEGMAAPSRIWIFSLLLFGGQVLPFLLTIYLALASRFDTDMTAEAAAGSTFALASRLLITARFAQPWDSAVLHPVGILGLLAIQWYALFRSFLRKPFSWKGRRYAST
jgi:cellulose synthase/poly-beta-1,6-N-acetylglucosamine synthase-like glycosyltransferase